ncbi:hypothetical protein [Caudovirales GX15bay]|nr:hypothetical protein [Caudovirales GX15bay]
MARSSAFSSSFDETAFRSAILNTMLMGIPEDADERLTFWWRREQVFSPDDPAGNPYDWTTPPTSDAPGNPDLTDSGTDQSLQVPYALEFSARPAGSSSTVLGEIDTSRAVVTLMDSDFEQVRTADYATIGNTHYRIQFSAPPVGLFGVTVCTLYLEAEDQV